MVAPSYIPKASSNSAGWEHVPGLCYARCRTSLFLPALTHPFPSPLLKKEDCCTESWKKSLQQTRFHTKRGHAQHLRGSLHLGSRPKCTTVALRRRGSPPTAENLRYYTVWRRMQPNVSGGESKLPATWKYKGKKKGERRRRFFLPIFTTIARELS